MTPVPRPASLRFQPICRAPTATVGAARLRYAQGPCVVAPRALGGATRRKLPRGICAMIVVGAGVGGLSMDVTAACAGFSVAVFERADVLGGTSTWSGGMLSIPGNQFAEQAG